MKTQLAGKGIVSRLHEASGDPVIEVPEGGVVLSLSSLDSTDYSGSAMICFYPDEQTQMKLALKTGESGVIAADDIHCTLMFLGDAAPLKEPDTLASLISIMVALSCSMSAVEARIGGLAKFCATPSSDGKDVLVALVDSPQIEPIRFALLDALSSIGIDNASEHGFTPHITLQYLDQGNDSLQDVDTQTPIVFKEIWLCLGAECIPFPLRPIVLPAEEFVDDFIESRQAEATWSMTKTTNYEYDDEFCLGCSEKIPIGDPVYLLEDQDHNEKIFCKNCKGIARSLSESNTSKVLVTMANQMRSSEAAIEVPDEVQRYRDFIQSGYDPNELIDSVPAWSMESHLMGLAYNTGDPNWPAEKVENFAATDDPDYYTDPNYYVDSPNHNEEAADKQLCPVCMSPLDADLGCNACGFKPSTSVADLDLDQLKASEIKECFRVLVNGIPLAISSFPTEEAVQECCSKLNESNTRLGRKNTITYIKEATLDSNYIKQINPNAMTTYNPDVNAGMDVWMCLVCATQCSPVDNYCAFCGAPRPGELMQITGSPQYVLYTESVQSPKNSKGPSSFAPVRTSKSLREEPFFVDGVALSMGQKQRLSNILEGKSKTAPGLRSVSLAEALNLWRRQYYISSSRTSKPRWVTHSNSPTFRSRQPQIQMQELLS